jgi:hypothetical protein
LRSSGGLSTPACEITERRRNVVWIESDVVAEVTYSELTLGRLRDPVLRSLRHPLRFVRRLNRAFGGAEPTVRALRRTALVQPVAKRTPLLKACLARLLPFACRRDPHSRDRARGDGGPDMLSTSSSSKSGTHLLPILLVSMVLLVAAFIILVATRAESAGVLGYGFIR